MKNKEHLTPPGLKQIVQIKPSQNLGLSSKLKKAYTDVSPVPRPIVKDQTIKDPNRLAGFTLAEGSFMINTIKSKAHSSGFQVKPVFQITQHSRNEQFVKNFIKYFNCGGVYKKGEAFDFRVTKFEDIVNKIIPFFFNTELKG